MAVFFNDFDPARVQNAGCTEGEGRMGGRVLDGHFDGLERPSEGEVFDSVLAAR